MPFEKKQTFSVNGYSPVRVYNGIYVAEIDETVKKFVDDLSLLTSYFRIMPEGDKRKIEAYKTYEKLFDLLTVLPEHAPDRGELAAASGIIGEFLSSLKSIGADEGIYVGLVGHSHLDTAWLWTVEEARRKALRTAANAVTLLKRYPEYRFVMSSALYMNWIEQDSPELFAEICALATWVECDCNLTDGESMIRQFVRGKRYLKEKFGYDADVFWLPDTFGYSAALPQILRGCGVPYFLTTKLSWNDTNRFARATAHEQAYHGARAYGVRLRRRGRRTVCGYGGKRAENGGNVSVRKGGAHVRFGVYAKTGNGRTAALYGRIVS